MSQVVPFPWDTSLPVVASYQRAMAALDPNTKAGFVSLEGYLVGRLVAEALNRVAGEPTREKLLDAMAAAPFDLGGVTLSWTGKKSGLGHGVFYSSSSRWIAQTDLTLGTCGGAAVNRRGDVQLQFKPKWPSRLARIASLAEDDPRASLSCFRGRSRHDRARFPICL